MDVRGSDDVAGNRITFVYVMLPCDEPDAVLRLMRIHRATSQHKLRGDAEGTDAALGALALAPRSVRRLAARAVAGPRMYNVVVSEPARAEPPGVPGGLPAARHPPRCPVRRGTCVSMGMCTVGGDACFGSTPTGPSCPTPPASRATSTRRFDELLSAG